MTLLLDTNAVVALIERGHDGVAQRVRQSAQWPTISLITVGELLAGIAMAASDAIAQHRRRTVRSVAQFLVHPIDRDGMRTYADVRRQGLRGNDAIVVAAAVDLGAQLITFDHVLATKAEAIVDVVLLAL